MRNLIVLVLALCLTACGNKTSKESETSNAKTISSSVQSIEKNYQSFGIEITDQQVLSSTEMMQKLQELKAGDTLKVKFSAPVAAVCKNKGCWMKLSLNKEERVHVTFKDYGFFVPKDIENQKAIVHGKAYLKEISVERLRHLAKDAGKSEEEIAAITEPELTYAFTADGVLLKE